MERQQADLVTGGRIGIVAAANQPRHVLYSHLVAACARHDVEAVDLLLRRGAHLPTAPQPGNAADGIIALVGTAAAQLSPLMVAVAAIGGRLPDGSPWPERLHRNPRRDEAAELDALPCVQVVQLLLRAGANPATAFPVGACCRHEDTLWWHTGAYGLRRKLQEAEYPPMSALVVALSLRPSEVGVALRKRMVRMLLYSGGLTSCKAWVGW